MSRFAVMITGATLIALWSGAHAEGEYQVVHRMTLAEGWKPDGGVVQDLASGALFGVRTNSSSGKWHSPRDRGCGSIFRMDPDGSVSTVYDFTAIPRNGCRVFDGLTLADGHLYGAAAAGGKNGHGTVFRTTLEGDLQVLHHFSGADGSLPNGELLRGTDGAWYGTTQRGGLRDLGTIFRITPDGKFRSLYQFIPNDAAGTIPRNGLAQGSDGRIYGTTSSAGTLFVLDEEAQPQPLHKFQGGQFGLDPTSLTPGTDGALYGACFSGGSFGLGMLYRWSAAKGFEHLHSFNGLDGDGPLSPPVELPAGGFIGTTYGLGLGDTKGTLYRFQDAGDLQRLHVFGIATKDGAGPTGKILVGTDGAWYGVSNWGGSLKFDGLGTGTVWRYVP
jgi:uncharacterized repeat protein (TIGR03803 family)